MTPQARHSSLRRVHTRCVYNSSVVFSLKILNLLGFPTLFFHQELVDLGGQYAAFARQLASHASDNVATTASGFTAAAPAAAAGNDGENGGADDADAVDNAGDASGLGVGVGESPSAVDEQLNAQLQSVLARLKPQATSSTHQLTPAEVEAVANLRRTLERIEGNSSRPRQ